jgi:hypothetical protein
MALLEAIVNDKEAQNNELHIENQRLILILRHLVSIISFVFTDFLLTFIGAMGLYRNTHNGGAGYTPLGSWV